MIYVCRYIDPPTFMARAPVLLPSVSCAVNKQVVVVII